MCFSVYKTIILPIIMCDCGVWPCTLREECKLQAFENEVLRKMFGCEGDEVSGHFSMLHNVELHD
jgi:hypothetical protein